LLWQGAAAERPEACGDTKQPNFTLKSFQVLTTANACDLAVRLYGSVVAAKSEMPWLFSDGLTSPNFMTPPTAMPGGDEDEGTEVWPAGTEPKRQ
jgi:hypothetical protein